MKDVLKINKVSQVFHQGGHNEVKAIEELSLSLRRDDFVILVGGNGSGKSTLLESIFSGIMTSGQVYLDGDDITELPVYMRSKKIGFVSQRTEEGSAGEFSILENLALASLKQNRSGFKKALRKENREKFRETINNLQVNLVNRLDSPVESLSGGERQVICVLMALVGSPSLLLCDEATASIDVKRSHVIERLIDNFSREHKIPVLWITHDPEQVLRLGNRVIVLENGRIVKEVDEAEKKSLSAEQMNALIRGVF